MDTPLSYIANEMARIKVRDVSAYNAAWEKVCKIPVLGKLLYDCYNDVMVLEHAVPHQDGLDSNIDPNEIVQRRWEEVNRKLPGAFNRPNCPMTLEEAAAWERSVMHGINGRLEGRPATTSTMDGDEHEPRASSGETGQLGPTELGDQNLEGLSPLARRVVRVLRCRVGESMHVRDLRADAEAAWDEGDLEKTFWKGVWKHLRTEINNHFRKLVKDKRCQKLYRLKKESNDDRVMLTDLPPTVKPARRRKNKRK